jgi:hypothetical protein
MSTNRETADATAVKFSEALRDNYGDLSVGHRRLLATMILSALTQREREVRAEERECESAWLVEKGPQGIGQVLYICANYMLEWTDDPNKALRLARREDADAICSIVEDADRVAEHEWPVISHSDTQEGS